MTRQPYQEPGSRTRYEYNLTDAGRELEIVVGALQQWGDRHLPRSEGPSIERRSSRTNRPVHVAFIDDLGYEVPWADVATIRTDAHPDGPADGRMTSVSVDEDDSEADPGGRVEA